MSACNTASADNALLSSADSAASALFFSVKISAAKLASAASASASLPSTSACNAAKPVVNTVAVDKSPEILADSSADIAASASDSFPSTSACKAAIAASASVSFWSTSACNVANSLVNLVVIELSEDSLADTSADSAVSALFFSAKMSEAKPASAALAATSSSPNLVVKLVSAASEATLLALISVVTDKSAASTLALIEASLSST